MIVDRVRCHVTLELLSDSVREPRQGKLTHGSEYGRTKEIGERCVNALGWVHVTVREPPPQCFWAHVDELDLGIGT